jgi:hypothetical protein
VPSINNSHSFGDGSFRWTEIFAVNGVINTSDADAKTDVQEDVPSWEFVKALRPVSYRWKVRKNEAVRIEDGTELVELAPAVLDEDGEELFSGFVEDWNYTYPAGGFDAIAEVSASDGFTILAQQTMTAGTQVAQLSGPRVTAVLDAAGWSAVKRDIGPGQSLLDADVVAASTNVLSYLQLVETSEFGALFIGRQGALTFRDRAQLQAFTTGVTFGA